MLIIIKKRDEKIDKNPSIYTNWYHIALKIGESNTKTVDGITYNRCRKCTRGDIFWTIGKDLNSRDEHDAPKIQKGGR